MDTSSAGDTTEEVTQNGWVRHYGASVHPGERVLPLSLATSLAARAGLAQPSPPASTRPGDPVVVPIETRPRARSVPPRFALEPSLGLGTPLGYVGGSVVVALLPALLLHAGVGLGQQGPQVEAGLRVRLPLASHLVLSPGASWSSGSFADWDEYWSTRFYWERAHFLNLTLGLDMAGHPSLPFRPFVGAGYVLNDAQAISLQSGCPERGCQPSFTSRYQLFAGVAMAFSIL